VTDVAIIGAGAMGKLAGGLLAGAGHAVWFLDPGAEKLAAIARSGVTLSHAGSTRHVAAQTVPAPEVDLAMVWCKAHATGRAIEQASAVVGASTVVCSLQNGLGNVEALERAVGPERVVHGVTTLGADAQGATHVELTESSWNGTARSWVGARSRGAWVAELLTGAGMPTEVHDDIDALVWSKLALSGAASGLGALTRLPLGALVDTEATWRLHERMTREIAAVARAKGIELDASTAIDRNRAALEGARDHLPSMLADVLAGRRTEIEAMCGAVVAEGSRLGVSVPVTEVVTELVRAIERTYDRRA
jgi:2-dehydropantoate 2-reductase